MITTFKKLAVAGLALAAIPALGVAKPPVEGGTPDIAAVDFVQKVKDKNGVLKLNNMTVYAENLGDGSAKNTRIEYYLSDDDVLSTETDTVIHTHSLGALKVGKTKKKTVGGGVIRNAGAVSGQYVIAVFDADNTTSETDENNNSIASDPLP